jgi:FkbM family methyltransferase
LKEIIIHILQSIFGYKSYLKCFSIVKIRTLKYDRRKAEFLYFIDLTREKEACVVIGACTGITTVPFAKNHGNRKVFAYEPLSSNFQVLNKVVGYFQLKNVHTYNIGLGSKTERREIILPTINGAKKQGLAYVKDSQIEGFPSGIVHPIEMDTVDNREELKRLKIDVLKVVAENFEYQIFLGAEKTIAANKPWIYCELWNNQNRKLVLDLMRRYDYQIYYRKNNKLKRADSSEYSDRYFFFIPNEVAFNS